MISKCTYLRLLIAFTIAVSPIILYAQCPLQITGVVTNNTSCEQLNGAIDITISPAGTYSFLWSNGKTTEDLTSLPGGTYTVTVTDNSGCSESGTFTVANETNSFSLSGVPTPNTSCTTPNGSIDLTITPPGTYTIQWTTGQTTEDINFLDEGVYRVVVTNSNNCSTSALFEITAETIDLVISEIITPATCGLPNGSIALAISPPGPAHFLWSTGDTIQNLSDLASGNYSVTVTDENNCTTEASYIVPGNGSSFSVIGVTTDNHSCTTPDGSILIEVSPAGMYTYDWSNGSSDPFQDGLSAGSYDVTVSDEFDCSIIQSFIINDLSDAPLVVETIVDETCELMNGAINLSVTPSVGNTYLWSTGDTGENLQNISAGIYSVTVTSPGGCVTIHQYEVAGSEAVEIELEADLTGLEANGTVVSDVTINMPIEAIENISWFPDENMSCQSGLCLQQIFTLEAPTEIMVMVTDTNGCIDQESLFLEFDIDSKVYIPNIFSPNSGVQNDRFTIFANQNVEEVVVLEIFNRWGNLVYANHAFPPNDPSVGWNGEYQGKLLDSDVFAYRAVVRFSDGKERTYRGDLMLVK